MDMSFPGEHGVNFGISKYWYEGEPCKVSLHDEMIDRIIQAGKGYYIYVRDLCRAFRQLHLCPLSFH